MPEAYVVKQGDCVSSVAFDRGFFWETLWNHASNRELKSKRKDPNVLKEGDLLNIPDRMRKDEPAATEARHRFKLKGVPALFRMAILSDGEPRAGEPYVLNVDGVLFRGKLDKEGTLTQKIPPDARKCTVTVGNDPERQSVYEVMLGELDPIDEITGIQARLNHLGFDAGSEEGLLGSATRAALESFQAKNKLQVTGQPDSPTKARLVELHGS